MRDCAGYNFLYIVWVYIWNPSFYICVYSSMPLESCTCCCDAAANTKLSALRLGSFRTAQTSQMLEGKISLLDIIVIYFAHGIYMNCGIRKGWVMVADALFSWGFFEANFESCFHKSPHSGGHLQLPRFASTCSHPPSFVHPIVFWVMAQGALPCNSNAHSTKPSNQNQKPYSLLQKYNNGKRTWKLSTFFHLFFF